MKKIFFTPSSKDAGEFYMAPQPSKSLIPDWYKDSPTYTTGKELDMNSDGSLNKNYKVCIPFLDSMTAGYMMLLPYDLLVRRQGEHVSFGWVDAPSLVKPRNNLIGMPRPAGHDHQAHVWTFHWGIKTPEGYSALVTHPFNRHDLPFVTTSGIIDSDNFSQGGEIPFFLRSDFDGVIPAGTPIAQVIPFKREAWKSEAAEFNETWFNQQVYSIRKHFMGAYKKHLWVKKVFE